MVESEAIYCTLTPEEQRNRRSEVRATIVPQVTGVTTLADGLRLEFGVHKGLRDLIQEFVVLEQGCCSFLTFTLSPPAEELSLLIQGPPDAAHIIEMFRRTAQGEGQ
jgi:hypothetical protein